MAAETQYTPNVGMVTISTANTALDGSGTLGTVLTAASGSSKGTFIKTVTIKAQTSTSQGMVRLFIYDGTNTKLLNEIPVPAITKSATVPSFETTVTVNFTLKAGWILKASTEIGNTFNVIAEAQDWVYYAASVRAETTLYTIYNAGTTISTANSNLDGTGTMGTALWSSGCNLLAVTIKAQGTTGTIAGMIRLFLYDGTNTMLFKEIPVTAITPSATTPTFYYKVRFNDGFVIKSGWYLYASTEKEETFTIVPESVDWSYPA